MNENDFLPRIPRTGEPITSYMAWLLERESFDDTTTPEEVMQRASELWNQTDDVETRAEVTQLLLGRRIDGGEIEDIHPLFSLYVFQGGEFEGLVSMMSQIATSEADKQ